MTNPAIAIYVPLCIEIQNRRRNPIKIIELQNALPQPHRKETPQNLHRSCEITANPNKTGNFRNRCPR